MSILTNASGPIVSLAPEGRPLEGCHPSIIDFWLEHGLPQWPKTGQGWRYWCGITSDMPEDVFMCVSNDGQNWIPAPHHASQSALPNATQVTDSSPYGHWADNFEDWITPNFSDDEIVYDPIGDQIMVYYNDQSGIYTGAPCGLNFISNTFLLSAATAVHVWDGVGIGAPSDMWAGMSPTVIREDATHWHHYSVAVQPGQGGNPDYYDIAYAFSTDGVTQSGPWKVCTHNGLTDQFRSVYPTQNPNHIKAKLNPFVPGQIEIVVATRKYNTPSLTSIQDLSHVRSTTSNPSEWSAPFAPTPLLLPRLPFSYWEGHEWDDTTSPYFDGYALYRADFILRGSADNLIMDLYYNAFNLPRFNGADPLNQIGFTSGVLTQPAPKVARKLRSPSGGKIKGKGAGKVSGKPQ